VRFEKRFTNSLVARPRSCKATPSARSGSSLTGFVRRHPDLDCPQIPFMNFEVRPPDPHNFDWDSDGIGCET
jgi:hypothetical protein